MLVLSTECKSLAVSQAQDALLLSRWRKRARHGYQRNLQAEQTYSVDFL